jgi:signal transduction histidine kinase
MTTPPASPTLLRTRYAGLWGRVPRELGYLLPVLPIAIASVAVLSSVFWTGFGLSFIFVGLFIVLASLFLARGAGMLEIIRLRYSGFPEITPPRWDRKARTGGSLAKAFAPFVDGHYWLYLLWAMVVYPILGIITWTITFVWVVAIIGGTSYWAYSHLFPNSDDMVHFTGLQLGSAVADTVGNLILGIGALLTLPFITRGMTWLHWQVARGMLGVFAADQLQERVVGLSSSRTAAVAAEGTALRRLERDIHDGPQQRLVRLQMDLSAADRQLDVDPAAARALIGEAMQQSKDALEELRALSRGFAPPLLLDRGLVAALDSMATRSSIPVRFVSELPADLVLPPELERNAYFIVAEAVTNAEKHSGATAITLRVWLREVAEPAETWLELTVSDDGVGGAVRTPDHGLAGLEERAHGLSGILTLTSPRGGPTVVMVQLPVATAGAAPVAEAPTDVAPAAPKKPRARKTTS